MLTHYRWFRIVNLVAVHPIFALLLSGVLTTWNSDNLKYLSLKPPCVKIASYSSIPLLSLINNTPYSLTTPASADYLLSSSPPNMSWTYVCPCPYDVYVITHLDRFPLALEHRTPALPTPHTAIPEHTPPRGSGKFKSFHLCFFMFASTVRCTTLQ